MTPKRAAQNQLLYQFIAGGRVTHKADNLALNLILKITSYRHQERLAKGYPQRRLERKIEYVDLPYQLLEVLVELVNRGRVRHCQTPLYKGDTKA